MDTREVHLVIRERLCEALAGRPWSWLATQSGVPQSTLAGQVSRCRFSLDTLLKVSRALEMPASHFLADPRARSEETEEGTRERGA